MIQQGLSYLMQRRTTFVIAHRLSTIRSADQILVVERERFSNTALTKNSMHRADVPSVLQAARSREQSVSRGGSEHRATGAVPQPIDNTGSVSHRLAEPTEEKLGRGIRSREDIPLTGLFQHPLPITLTTRRQLGTADCNPGSPSPSMP